MTGRWQDVPLPPWIAALPRDEIGRPVPWFVASIDGKPDFRVIDLEKMTDAARFDRCWVCGGHRGRYATFVIGPMCAISRVSAEPPAHRECGTYAAQACPFLTTPTMNRRTSNHPTDVVDPPGQFIRRNPGVVLVWTTKHWRRFQADDGHLYSLGIPEAWSWWSEGRPAHRHEVMASISSGMPILRDAAKADGPRAETALAKQLRIALMLLPAAA